MLWCAAPGVGASGPLAMHLAACGFPYTEGDSLADSMMYTFGGGTEEDPIKRSVTFAQHWANSALATREELSVEATIQRALEVTEHEDIDAAGRMLNEAAQGSLAWDGGDARRNSVVATSPFKGTFTLLWYRSRRNFCDGEYIGEYCRVADLSFTAGW